MRQKAFTLVELSIVLVILGLLVGGVLAGQSLIRAAELRSVATEYNNWHAALYSFRDKYFAVPGDFNNATAFWGKDNVVCTSHTGTTATPGTCNGNGDGAIAYSSGAGTLSEQYLFWQHLARAGMIEGSYSAVSGSGNEVIFGTNAPRSKLGNAGWGMARAANFAGDASTYRHDYGNLLSFGRAAGSAAGGQILKPEELWNIDTKIDDGRPAYGKIIATFWSGCTLSTTFSDFDKDYRLDSSAIACGFYSPRFF